MDLIIAMVLAAMITRAWEESKRQSKAAWQEAQRAAAERRAAWEERRRAAAAARRRRIIVARITGPSDPLWWLWATGWLIAATARGTAAAIDGARQGAAVGAREGYRIGHERAQARRARRLREQSAYRRGRADGHAEATRPSDQVDTAPCPRCGTYMPDPAACPCRTRRASSTAGGPEVVDAEIVGDAPTRAPTDESEVIDAEIVEDPNHTTDTPTAIDVIEGNTEMAQLTSGISGGDGEGYATTINALNEIRSLLEQVNQVVTDLGDTLTAKNVDAETTNLISELDDHLQAATDTVGQAAKHAEDKHGEVAAAIAGAGGSSEIADPDWYDTV